LQVGHADHQPGVEWMLKPDSNAVVPRMAEVSAAVDHESAESGIAWLMHVLTGLLGGTTVGGEITHKNPDPKARASRCSTWR
jgi:hypothetical protein